MKSERTFIQPVSPLSVIYIQELHVLLQMTRHDGDGQLKIVCWETENEASACVNCTIANYPVGKLALVCLLSMCLFQV